MENEVVVLKPCQYEIYSHHKSNIEDRPYMCGLMCPDQEHPTNCAFESPALVNTRYLVCKYDEDIVRQHLIHRKNIGIKTRW